MDQDHKINFIICSRVVCVCGQIDYLKLSKTLLAVRRRGATKSLLVSRVPLTSNFEVQSVEFLNLLDLSKL